MVEHYVDIVGVAGSSPVLSTNIAHLKGCVFLCPKAMASDGSRREKGIFPHRHMNRGIIIEINVEFDKGFDEIEGWGISFLCIMERNIS